MSNKETINWGPGDLRTAHEQIDKAFWELSNWFHSCGPDGYITTDERAEKLGVPVSVIEDTELKLASLGHLANTLEQLVESCPKGVGFKDRT